MNINDFKKNIQKSSRFGKINPNKSTSFYDNLPPINDKLFYNTNIPDNTKENVPPNLQNTELENEMLEDRFMTTNQYQQRFVSTKPTLCVSPITRYDNGWAMLNKVNTYINDKKVENDKNSRLNEKKRKLDEFTVYFGEKKESSKIIVTTKEKERELADTGYQNFVDSEKQKVFDQRVKGIEFQKFQQEQATTRNNKKSKEKSDKLDYEHKLIDIDHQLAMMEAEKAQEKKKRAISNIKENQVINEQISNRKRQEQAETLKRDTDMLNERILMDEREFQENQKHIKYINEYNKKYKDIKLPVIFDKSKPNLSKISAEQEMENIEFDNKIVEKKLMKEKHKEEYIKNYNEFMKNKQNKQKKVDEPFQEEFIIPDSSRSRYGKQSYANNSGDISVSTHNFDKIITSPINETVTFGEGPHTTRNRTNIYDDDSNTRDNLEYMYNLMGHEDLNIVKTNQTTIRRTKDKKFGL